MCFDGRATFLLCYAVVLPRTYLKYSGDFRFSSAYTSGRTCDQGAERTIRVSRTSLGEKR
jgi:hypothetical protein